jgi:hypothetical protein
MLGNSLKYSTQGNEPNSVNSLWKYFQKKNSKVQGSTPAHLILLPPSDSSLLSNLDFSTVNPTISKDNDAFKHIQKSTKSSPVYTNSDLVSAWGQLKKVSNLYSNDFNSMSSDEFYTLRRQPNYSSTLSSLPSYTSLVDLNSSTLYKTYNFASPNPTMNASTRLALPTYSFTNEAPTFSLFLPTFSKKNSS